MVKIAKKPAIHCEIDLVEIVVFWESIKWNSFLKETIRTESIWQ